MAGFFETSTLLEKKSCQIFVTCAASPELLLPPPQAESASTATSRRASRLTSERLDLLERPRTWADVFRRRAEELPLALLLEDVRRPARDARAREHRRSDGRRHLGDVEDERRVVLDVRLERPVGLAPLELGERGLLEALGDLDLRRAKLARGVLEDARARILGAVDAMAEAHDPLAGVERVLHPALRVAHCGDLLEHRLD